MTTETALFWSERLVCFSIALQAFEFLQIQKRFPIESVWSWDLIRRDFEFFPQAIQSLLRFFYSSSHFRRLLRFHLVTAVACLLFPNPIALTILFLTTFAVLWRWRGIFNGGSDFMTMTVLLPLVIARWSAGAPTMAAACLYYIGLQLTLSYFIAGLVKLRSPRWRSGHALGAILEKRDVTNTKFKTFSWVTIVWECLFPLVFVFKQTAIRMLAIGLLFHLINVFVFGLNRFLWAWLAAYPALYYCIFHFHLV